MSPKKRKAGMVLPTRQKRVRIGSSSVIGEDNDSAISASGRPKRSTAGEPSYDQTRHHLGAPSVIQEPETSSQRGLDRPRKALPASPTTTKNATTKKPVGKQSKTVTYVEIPTKKRGPPPGKVTKAASKATSVATSALPKSTKPHGRPARTIKAEATSVPLGDSTGAVVQEAELEDEVKEQEGIEDERQFWLMKAEPESRIEKGHDVKFSIDDLMDKKGPEGWDGVRNPAARNNMRAMREGDLAFFYHSNCSVPGIAGIMEVVQEHSVDESAFDPSHPYYDSKSDRNKPKWELVHVTGVHKFANFVTLKELKSHMGPRQALENMQTLKQSRLSVSRVTAKEWNFIMELSGEEFGEDEALKQVVDDKAEPIIADQINGDRKDASIGGGSGAFNIDTNI